MLLWPPDGSQVTVTVSGIANDAASGVASINWSVDDEYNQVEPIGSISAVNGTFSFPIVLVRDRRGNDKNGRHYTILVTATDPAGNMTSADADGHQRARSEWRVMAAATRCRQTTHAERLAL